MKKKLITAIALSLCFCSVFSACGKKDEATATAPDTTKAVTENKPATDADKPVTDTPAADTTSATSVAVAVVPTVAPGVAVAEDITADMTDEQRAFYNSLRNLGGQALSTKEFLAEGISIDELSGGAYESEEEYIRGVCQYSASSISNAERQEKATEVFTNHFWEIADNCDPVTYAYPDWETLYNEYAGGSTGTGFTSSVIDNDTFSATFASSSLVDNKIYSKDGVDFTIERISAQNMNLKVVNNNINNKKVRFILENVCINGFGIGSMWDSGEVLVGNKFSSACDVDFYELVKYWNAYGISLNDAPIETIGIYYRVQIGSDSEFEYAYAELKTNNYSTGDKLFGTKLGSIDYTIPNQDRTAEIPVTASVYRYDAVDGIIISIVGNYPAMKYGYNPLMIGEKQVAADAYTYGGEGAAVWIKLTDEDTLRREYELGPDEPMNLRYETQFGSVTIIE